MEKKVGVGIGFWTPMQDTKIRSTAKLLVFAIIFLYLGYRLIVLATESVLPEQHRQLRADGAIVKIIRAILPLKGVDIWKTKER